MINHHTELYKILPLICVVPNSATILTTDLGNTVCKVFLCNLSMFLFFSLYFFLFF